MATTEVTTQEKIEVKEGVWRVIRHFAQDKPLGAVGAIVFAIMILIAILAPLISPNDPLTTDIPRRLTGPSLLHLMGTDEVGRDVLSRLIHGARVSIMVGIIASVVGSMGGAILGIISGYAGGRVDLYMQRVMDVLMAFPILVLAIAIMAVMGTSVTNVIIAMSIPFIPRANRVVRSVAISVKEFQFVEAARAVGASPVRIVFRHVLPNCMASYLIVATSLLGSAILIEASLSFLGLGIPPPFPSWGRSLSEAMPFYLQAPWLAIFPGIAISLAVFGANLFGDALRDVWDPRLKRL
ncbi:ABC transporter permease [Chloroflexota bacterium]